MKKTLTIFALLTSGVAMGQIIKIGNSVPLMIIDRESTCYVEAYDAGEGIVLKSSDKEAEKIFFAKGIVNIKPSLFAEWDNYLVDCNKLVPDTIKQSGVVNFEYKPVIFEGKVIHFNAVPIDTVWEKEACNDYKRGDENETLFYGGGRFNANGNYQFTSLSLAQSITYTEPKQAKSTIKITRDKICMIKKQKASWGDFWNRWCKIQNLVKFN